ncbi:MULTISPECIES: universal stress protein [Streptomyces]|uniref:Universal stress protein n=1 Tax=Streptomyces lonegramiae TaxID=3075524 RepID=A0ABU2X8J7_9ACTN|nr:universal stress protein [Streptomyces sp. DSM 41529]MDT0541682.1 universal stress protein [Streptomyces sp. DSM 41529]
MSLSLVVGVDGSESSLQAVDWAVDEAARHGLPVRLVHASRWERYEGGFPVFATGRSSGEILAEQIAASATERATLRDPDVKACGEALAEDTVTALLAAGREAFAVVTGSRGRGELAGSLLGSVSLAVAARAMCPVIVVRGGERNREGAFGRVVLAVGDPSEGLAAAHFAFREARARNAEVHAVRTWLCPAERHAGRTLLAHEATTLLYEEQATSILNEVLDQVEREHREITCHRDVVEGRAHQVLLGMSERADLLVVGALRRPDHTGLQLGRVSHAVLHHCACPVAVVPERR